MDEFSTVENTEEENRFAPQEDEHFMVEDKEESIQACSMCSLRAFTKDGKNYVCGTYKARNDFAKSKGKPDIQDDFYCSEIQLID